MDVASRSEKVSFCSTPRRWRQGTISPSRPEPATSTSWDSLPVPEASPLARTAEEMEIAKGLCVQVAAIEDLIKMKRAAARPKDLIEAEILSALLDERENK